MNPIPARDVQALIEIFEASDWQELHLEVGDLQLHLAKDASRRRSLPAAGGPGPQATAAAAVAAAVAPAAPAAGAVAAPATAGLVAVTAPNLGTFYRAPKPGAAPFVEIGQHVTADTEICLIEVMKLFTTVRAGVAGVLRQACVADAEMVEHGQVLFYVEPAR